MRAYVAVAALLLGALVSAPAEAAAPEGDLSEPAAKEIAMQLVSSAENSSLDWRRQYRYIEDIGDGRGYTAGIVGFCSGTGDMLQVVRAYTRARPGNPLARFLPALKKVDGTDSHAGLGRPFVTAWRQAAADPAFQAAQDHERDRQYFDPAVTLARHDGLGALGQLAYYDAAVVHGFSGLKSIRRRALAKAAPPSAGEAEPIWLRAFLAGAAARDEEGAGPRRAAGPDHQDPAPLPARGQPRPGPAAAVDGQPDGLRDPG